jgi:hypothetical protein
MAKKNNIFSKKNFNTGVGIISLLFLMWLILYAVPSLFVSLFNTFLGIAILIGIVFLIAIFNRSAALGLAFIFIILYQFSHMSAQDEPDTNTNTNTNTKS